MGTSSMLFGLIIGGLTPIGMRSKLARSFSLTLTRLRSGSSPTLKRTMTRLSLSREVLYRYSTPGTSQSSFSMGRVARSSISLAVEPGMATMTSIIGTLICGSSSRGSSTTAAAPSRTEAMTSSGVSFESMKATAMRPAMPRGAALGGSLMAAGSRVGRRSGGWFR